MNLLRRAVRESTAIRIALIFVAMAFSLDLLAALMMARFTPLLTLWGLAYFGIVFAGFVRGASWARDPVIPTIGRAPELRNQVAGDARISSRTVQLPLDSSAHGVLMSYARRRSREGRAWVVLGSCFVCGAALFVAVQVGDLLLLAAALLIAFVPAAFIWVLAGPPTSTDAERGRMYRTEGQVRLEWVMSRGGRSWTVRVGDRALHVWDDVGLRLANMPWGVIDYTESGRIIRVRDMDENTVYELRSPPDVLIMHHASWLGPLLLVGWVALSLLVRAAR